MNYWIKERNNPQTGVYYVACGKLSRKAVKRHERPLYGSNRMLPYPSKEGYEAAIKALKEQGKSVHTTTLCPA